MYNTVSVMGSGTVRVDHNLVSIGKYFLVAELYLFYQKMTTSTFSLT